ncbi:OmpH family outer membrane protein [Crocinitomix algicola]|uniref:OmpH family outer membrane protein n=1 Tax=Crocinitomix algicola TaxID=1740263 RepID=UPI0008727573|nr:OmpH family outer membrane protein [Crocinitomix algicola]
MKKVLLILFVFFGLVNSATAQRYAFVDSQYILDQMPEYAEAQAELDKASEDWQKEIEQLFLDVERKRKEYAEEAILLPAEIKKQREKEIEAAEQKAKEMQKQRFGVGGDLFAKRAELIKPIQDKIFNAIQAVASSSNLAFVFDKANQSNLLYADQKYNISDRVLAEMDIKPKN